MSFLTGKPAKSTSENVAFPWLKEMFGGMAGTGNAANEMSAAALGIGGDPDAASGAYKNFLNSTGYNTVVDEAMRGVTGSAGAKGIRLSGATAKALQDRASGLGQRYFENWLGQLGNVAGRGLQAGGLIGGAGQRSTSTGGTPGLGGMIGQGLGMIPMFSDRRLKVDVERIGTLGDGLGIYRWRYLWDAVRTHVGVMADEVARLRPWALGPTVGGYATVRYDLLGDA
jgi:hypothetical protein